jgi:hypothetical protein
MMPTGMFVDVCEKETAGSGSGLVQWSLAPRQAPFSSAYLSPVSLFLNMFCNACQDFWREAISKAVPRDVVKTSEDICWAAFSTILHSNMGELKRAAELGCQTCRIIYASPTVTEHETVLKDKDEDIDVVLRFESKVGPLPALWVDFEGAADFPRTGERKRLVVKRIIAAYDGLITDGVDI